jgi:hypothetical protein
VHQYPPATIPHPKSSIVKDLIARQISEGIDEKEWEPPASGFE